MTENWRQQMRRKMEGYSEPAPELSWADLENALPAAKTKRIPTVVYWTAAAAAAVLLGIGIGTTFRNEPSDEEFRVADNTPVNTAPETVPGTSDSIEDGSGIEDTPESGEVQTPSSGRKTASGRSLLAYVPNENVTPSENDDSREETTVGEGISGNGGNALGAETTGTEKNYPVSGTGENTGNAIASGDEISGQNGAEEQNEDGKGTKEDKPEEVKSGPYVRTPDPFSLADEPVKEQRRGLSVGAFMSNTPGKMEVFGRNDSGLMSEPVSGGILSASNTDGIPYQNNITIDSDMNHRQPIRGGLRLRYNLGHHWGVESGITYSYLASDYSQSSKYMTTSVEQKLSYLGIPLNVTRDIVEGNRWQVYASAGGMVEKMVKGRRHFTTTVGGEKNASFIDKVRIDPLQYSVNAAIGVQYRIWNGIGIYAEPSIDYHFDNGSPVPTFYSDKPLNFALSLGLRFDFAGK